MLPCRSGGRKRGGWREVGKEGGRDGRRGGEEEGREGSEEEEGGREKRGEGWWGWRVAGRKEGGRR